MRSYRTLLLASLLTLPGALAAQTSAEGPPPNDYEGYKWEPDGDAMDGMDPMGGGGGEEAPMRRRFRDRLNGREGGGDFPRGELRQRMRERFQQGGGTFGGGPNRKGRRGKGGKGRFGKFGKGGGGGQELMARVRELDPGLASELEALQDKVPPQERKRLLQEIARNVKQFVQESIAGGIGGNRKEAKGAIQEIAIMELRTLVSAMQARHGGADPAATKTKLKGELQALFDRKVQLQEERMKVMQAKLADLQKLITERKSHKAEIVDQRLGELMGTAKKFDW